MISGAGDTHFNKSLSGHQEVERLSLFQPHLMQQGAQSLGNQNKSKIEEVGVLLWNSGQKFLKETKGLWTNKSSPTPPPGGL